MRFSRYLRRSGLLGLLTSSLIALSALAADQLLLDVAEASATYDKRTGEPIVLIRLSEESGKVFATFSEEHIGHTVEFRLGTEVLMSPVIRSPILGGSLQLSGELTRDEARAVARRLTPGGKIEAVVVAR